MTGDHKLLIGINTMDLRYKYLTGERAILHCNKVEIGPISSLRVVFFDMTVTVTVQQAYDYLKAQLALVEEHAWH